MEQIVSNITLQLGAVGLLLLVLLLSVKFLYNDGKARETYILDENAKREQRMMDENLKREEKYQTTINNNQEIILNMTKALETVETVKDDVKELKNIIVSHNK